MNGISVMPCVQGKSLLAAEAGMMYGTGCMAGRKRIVLTRRVDSDRSSRMEGPADAADGRTGRRNVKSGMESRDRSARRVRSGRPVTAARAMILIAVFCAMLAGFGIITVASSRQKVETYKYYTPITIAYGEDLTDIVYRYCDSSEYATADDYVREICEINSLPYEKGRVPDVHAGTRIVIPYYDTELK
ncbi:MAG: hypothetical protein IJG15_02080 [Lachnospiraceae bacterium]|nr:hypothetical protein [Lachnospiraceae bacterium]